MSARMKNSHEVVANLRELLKLTGITQRELARRLGTTPSHLNLYFTGKSDMHSAKLIEILHVLGIDLDSLIQERIGRILQNEAEVDPSCLYVKLQNMASHTREPLLRIIKTLAG